MKTFLVSSSHRPFHRDWLVRFGLAALLAALLWLLMRDQAFPQSTISVLPLGDSITQGEGSVAPDYYYSYRRELGQLLQANGYSNVDLVGSHDVNLSSSVPTPDFDADHEGHWGWRADQILNGCVGCPGGSGSGMLSQWLTGYTPDIVLLHLGHNDLKEDPDVSQDTAVIDATLDDLAQIIDALQADNPNVTILLAKLIPSTRSPRDRRIPLFNAELDAFAPGQETATSSVLVVDQFTGFDPTADPTNSGSGDTYDGTHPNHSGEQKMAQAWYDALVPLLGAPPAPTPTPTATPSAAVTISFTPEADTYINETTPTQNFGNASQLRVVGDADRSETYLRFNVTGIPAGMIVTDARVIFRATNRSNNSGELAIPVSLYDFDPNVTQWSELSPTWNNPLTGTVGTLLSTVTGVINNGDTVTFTGLESEVTDNGRYTFYIMTERLDGTAFASSESSPAPRLEVTYQEPLAVELESFEALPLADHVAVRWATAWEVDNLGFHLYRGVSAAAPEERLTQALIPSQAPGSGQGATYEYLDHMVQPGTTYFYWLDDVATDGRITRHGPVSVTVGSPTAVVVGEWGTRSRTHPTMLLLLMSGLTLLLALHRRYRTYR